MFFELSQPVQNGEGEFSAFCSVEAKLYKHAPTTIHLPIT